MLELTIILIIIAVLFVGVAWLDKKINNSSLEKFNVSLGIMLMIGFLIVLCCLVERVINFLILNYVN